MPTYSRSKNEREDVPIFYDTPSCFCEQNAKTIQDYSGKKDGKNKKNAYLCRIFQ
jgi:hypothetical protein